MPSETIFTAVFPEEGMYTLSLYGMQGRLVAVRTGHAQPGEAHIAFPELSRAKPHGGAVVLGVLEQNGKRVSAKNMTY